ncbi:MAG: hypothetical protein MZU95_02785 [Desulfomicrobium escambiense]|nr:hypothetical protein [Desulfomicrobium escambiense]
MTTADRREMGPVAAAGRQARLRPCNLFHLLFPGTLDTWNERLNDQFLALKTSIAAFAPPTTTRSSMWT